MTTTTTTSLSLLWFPFPFAFSHQASSNLSIPTSNPNPFNDFWSFHSSASSSSYSRKLCLGRRSISFRSQSNLSSRRLTWLSGYTKRDQNMDNGMNEDVNRLQMFGSNEEVTTQIPTQAQTIVKGSGEVLVSEYKPVPDVDYLQELLAIQQQGPRAIGFFGTRNIGFMHQQLIEILSYAMVITKNHIYTSGASGTNAAVIRGALRAEKPELLTVILPQSLKKQPPESQELLAKVRNVIEKPHNDHLPLIEASRLCNMDIISHVQQVICFAFHDSKLLMETCQEAKNLRKIVTLFYLD
ncbi:hypothetical protein U1Q18_024879 [Sarracenia purpurea var. burkii]